ncbi:MAG: hypothetical protein RIQ60_722 [Pseudomonadota bacterium]|jgi:DNA polymerase
MTWSTHQQDMLREMGIRLWLPPPAVQRGPDGAPAANAPPAQKIQSVPTLSAQPNDLASAAFNRSLETALVGQASGVTADKPSLLTDQMDWDDLGAAVSSCRACGLCESRRQTVFGVGNRQARWMLIGEAPGEQEDREGEPFVGKAGQLLDNMLRAAKLTRSDAEPKQQVYIANVLKCRPPQNRNPLPEEVARCEPFLRRQVALVQPDLILAMGRFAVQSLLGSQEPIGRLRGRVHEYLGVPVVVTYHPAYLLRNPLDKSRSWEDLCLAHEVWARRKGMA